MEAFSLLKYWRGGGGVFTRDNPSNPMHSSSSSSATTTIITAVSPSSSLDSDSDGGDDGPFFDFEFTLPGGEEESQNAAPNIQESDNGNDNPNEDELVDEEEDEGEEIKFTLSPSSSSSADDEEFSDPNTTTVSPSDDLFFKGHLVPIDSSSASSESLSNKFPPVSSLLKSATKFRVQMLKFNKSKPSKPDTDKTVSVSPPKSHLKNDSHDKGQNRDEKQMSKIFKVKLKVEQVPLVSLFTRDASSKGAKQNNGCNDVVVVEDEKKASKDVMQKYLQKVKPLYIRVSKRYGDKLRFSGQLSFPKSGSGPPPPPPPAPPSKAEVESPAEVKAGGAEVAEVAAAAASNNVKTSQTIQKQGNLQAGLRVVCKHLGKSRSASSSVPAPAPAPAPVVSKRRDDSLLQQQDGIQSAILHCKRSLNASRDLDASVLSRSASDPSHEKAKGDCN
ncbi:hypothetical protein ACH5RR_041653 [Cinchona calisaya]|uniref:Membrane-associated kinase regulator 2 n=1 Tax=Cinchona calisaya TaxID=153742 RepID=A0ABD2XU67_9GENT